MRVAPELAWNMSREAACNRLRLKVRKTQEILDLSQDHSRFILDEEEEEGPNLTPSAPEARISFQSCPQL